MTDPKDRSGFDDFRDLLERYGQAILWITGTSIVLPAAAYKVDILPPWPSGVVLITAVMQMVVMAVVFQICQTAKRRAVTWSMIVVFVALLGLSSAYFLFMSDLTFTGGPAKERQVKGFVCSSEAMSMPRYAAKCPALDQDLIASATTADKLWTSESITRARLLLLIVWIASYGAFSSILVMLITFQSAQRGRFWRA
ncbi:hypothetical protein G6M16_006150 [Agrobacterium tumefaciens]|nr:hypothetical protein G6M16_006150 [Agrobacterium tumefaciens]